MGFFTRLVRPLGRPMRIHGESMMPLLGPGALVFVDDAAYRDRAPGHGEVVAARPASLGGRAIVKRVAGLPSERVTHGTRAWDLGPDEFVLLGDHAEDSLDSRRLGPIRRAELIGRVWLRLWPFPRHFAARNESRREFR